MDGADWKARAQAAEAENVKLREEASEAPMTSKQVREFALRHDHFAVPVRRGVTITWTDEETGEVINRASIKGRNVVPLATLKQPDSEEG